LFDTQHGYQKQVRRQGQFGGYRSSTAQKISGKTREKNTSDEHSEGCKINTTLSVSDATQHEVVQPSREIRTSYVSMGNPSTRIQAERLSSLRFMALIRVGAFRGSSVWWRVDKLQTSKSSARPKKGFQAIPIAVDTTPNYSSFLLRRMSNVPTPQSSSGYASPAPSSSLNPPPKPGLPKSKPTNVFSNDGSFLERFQRSKRVRLFSVDRSSVSTDHLVRRKKKRKNKKTH
jgi:hypothetical protein